MTIHTLSTNERYGIVQKVGHILNSSLDLDVVLGRLAVELRAIFPLDHTALTLENLDGKTCTWTNITSGSKTLSYPHNDIPIEGATLGWFKKNYQNVRYIVYEDLSKKLRFGEDEIVLKRGIRSGIRVPLEFGKEIFGNLSVSSFSPNRFTSEMAEFLAELAPSVSIAVSNARTFAQLEANREELKNETLSLRTELREIHNFEELIGNSKEIERVKDLISKVAESEVTVLISGETGTGKELIARAIHNLSSRKDRALVKVNCAALQDTLLLSELFGHEKGSFTGAIAQKIGRFELAHNGTIFLDEIGEISMEAQVKILRVMQEREFERVGGNKTIKIDTRIIAATNRNLEEEVSKGKYRSDLYFRLNVIPIEVPPLRERKEDIPMLIQHFIAKHGKRLNRNVKGVGKKALERLMFYDWPGNIRELENVVERGLVLGRGDVLRFDKQMIGEHHNDITRDGDIFYPLDEMEKRYITKVLEKTGGVVAGERGAARILGMKPTTLYSRIKKLGIKSQRKFQTEDSAT